MTDRVLIDLNSVGRAAHKGTVLKSGSQETQAVYGLIRTFRALRVRHPNATIVALYDGRSWRKDASDTYKGNRDDTPEKVAERTAYKSQASFIRRALRHLGIPQLFALNLEADDLAGVLAAKYAAAGDFVRLVTGDQDWIQMVGPNVIWEDHREETRKVNQRSFKQFTGVDTPRQFMQLKALTGDVSDNIKGVGGIGDDRGLDLLTIWGSVEAFLADPDPQVRYLAERITPTEGKKGKPAPAPHKTMPKALRDFHQDSDGQHERYASNVRLMSLIDSYAPDPVNMTLLKGEFDEQGFKTLCHELAFSSIFRDPAFETFVAPFRKQ